MSAGKKWHDGTPTEVDAPLVPQAILSWVRELGEPNPSASSQPADSASADTPRESTLDSPETIAILLRAIEGTDIAALLEGVPLPGDGHSHTVDFAEPAVTVKITPEFKRPPASPPAAASVQTELPPASTTSAPTPASSQESPGRSADLLRAIQDTEIASILEESPSRAKALQSPAPPNPAEMAVSGPVSMPPVVIPPPLAAFAKPEPLASSAPPPSTPASPQESPGLPAALLSATQSTEIAPILEELPSAKAPPPPTSPKPAEVAAPGPVPMPAVIPPTAAASAKPRPAPPPSLAASSRPESTRPRPATIANPPKQDAPVPVSPAPIVPPREKPAAATVRPPVATPSGQPATARPPSAISGIPALLSVGRRCLATALRPVENCLDRAEAKLESWFLKWFEPPDPRHSRRLAKPPLVAYRWILNTPQAIKISNVSSGGLYLLTEERWSEGNIISMTLQRTDKERGDPESWIAVDFVVMRRYKDGVAGAFIPSRPGLDHAVAGRATNCADQKTLEQFFEQLSPSGRKPARQHARKTLAAADRIRRSISSQKGRLRRLSALVPLRSKAGQQDGARK